MAQTKEQVNAHAREYYRRCRSRREYLAQWKRKNMAKVAEYVRVHRRRYPEQEIAHRAAHYHLKHKPCEICGDPKTDRHHDDYSRPLSVRHLCRIHHAELHRITE